MRPPPPAGTALARPPIGSPGVLPSFRVVLATFTVVHAKGVAGTLAATARPVDLRVGVTGVVGQATPPHVDSGAGAGPGGRVPPRTLEIPEGGVPTGTAVGVALDLVRVPADTVAVAVLLPLAVGPRPMAEVTPRHVEMGRQTDVGLAGAGTGLGVRRPARPGGGVTAATRPRRRPDAFGRRASQAPSRPAHTGAGPVQGLDGPTPATQVAAGALGLPRPTNAASQVRTWIGTLARPPAVLHAAEPAGQAVVAVGMVAGEEAVLPGRAAKVTGLAPRALQATAPEGLPGDVVVPP